MSRSSASAASVGLLTARVAALGRAVEEPVEEVAEGDEDRDDEERLRELLPERQVRREQEHRAEHDRSEDGAAPERARPGRLLRIAARPTRLRRLPCGRLAGRSQLGAVAGAHAAPRPVVSPPALTVCPAGPPRCYARGRPSSAAPRTTSASYPAARR